MFNSLTNRSGVNKFKKLRMLIMVCTCIFVFISASGCGKTNEPKDLSELMKLDKQTFVKEMGNPTTVLRDDQEEFRYVYDSGISIVGDRDTITTISLENANVTKDKPKTYKLCGVMLDSSFTNNVQRLNTPDVMLKRNDTGMAIYLRADNSVLILMTRPGGDEVTSVSIVPYTTISSLMTLNADTFLTDMVSNINSDNSLNIKITEITSSDTIYTVSSNLKLYADNNNKKVHSIQLNGPSIYNIFKFKVGDSIDSVQREMGMGNSTNHLPDTNERVITFLNEDKTQELVFNVNETTNKINKIEYNLKG